MTTLIIVPCRRCGGPDVMRRGLGVCAACREAMLPPCDCGCPGNTPTQHGAFCARYSRLR